MTETVRGDVRIQIALFRQKAKPSSKCESAPKVDPSRCECKALIYRHKVETGWGHDRRR